MAYHLCPSQITSYDLLTPFCPWWDPILISFGLAPFFLHTEINILQLLVFWVKENRMIHALTTCRSHWRRRHTAFMLFLNYCRKCFAAYVFCFSHETWLAVMDETAKVHLCLVDSKRLCTVSICVQHVRGQQVSVLVSSCRRHGESQCMYVANGTTKHDMDGEDDSAMYSI